MRRNNLFTHALVAVALAAGLLVLTPAAPAAAVGGPYALQIPTELPTMMMTDLQQVAAPGNQPAGSHSMMTAENGSMMTRDGSMMAPSAQATPAQQVTQERLEALVSRLEATSGDEQTKVMVKLLESLVAERGQMLQSGMSPMQGMHGMRAMAGMHALGGMHARDGVASGHSMHGMHGMHASQETPGMGGASMMGQAASSERPCTMAPEAEESAPSDGEGSTR